MKKIFKTIVSLAATVFIAGSCTDDPVGNEKSDLTAGKPAKMSLVLNRIAITDDALAYLDYEISTLRVMGYDANADTLVFNRLVTPTSDGSNTSADANPDIRWRADVEAVTGEFTIVLIANEGVGQDFSDLLSDYTKVADLDDLKDLSISHESILWNGEIPMYARYENVQVISDTYIIHNGTSITGEAWEVEVQRLAVRVDLTLSLPAEQVASVIQSNNGYTVTLNNIPEKMFLLPETSNSSENRISKTYEAISTNGYPDAPGLIEQESNGEYTITFPRIILPESYFTNKNEENLAVVMEIKVSEGGSEKTISATIGYDPAISDYTLPRNTYLTVNGTVESTYQLKLNLGVWDWDTRYADAMYNGDRRLNVSLVSGAVNAYNRMRVYFRSDYPEVILDEYTKEGLPLDNLFYGLTGSTDSERYNFHYTYNSSTKEGDGYFDIMTDNNKSGVNTGTNTHKLYLDAGGLRREITVDVSRVALATYNYVGAFWRNNQTGERVITGVNSGSWTAEVTSGNFIILNTDKSLDPYFQANGREPGDPEVYQVDGNETFVSGSGDVFFRIGLTSTYTPTKDYPARYGVVTVTSSSGSSYNIYIRQGEDDDYLMRPKDNNEDNSLTLLYNNYRNNTKMFSPFNLTSQDYLDNIKTGGANLSDHATSGSAFTEYPTQAGALFQMNSPYYYHPVNDKTAISGWSTLATVEIPDCPEGYSRPTDNQVGTIRGEFRESLWLNPTASAFNDPDKNSEWGYYADGFFDRRPLTDNVMVSGDDNRAAYIGRLFYNKFDNTSLFFPVAGYRNTTNGGLSERGIAGGYWPAYPNGGSDYWHFSAGENKAGMQTAPIRTGFSVRCVFLTGVAN